MCSSHPAPWPASGSGYPPHTLGTFDPASGPTGFCSIRLFILPHTLLGCRTFPVWYEVEGRGRIRHFALAEFLLCVCGFFWFIILQKLEKETLLTHRGKYYLLLSFVSCQGLAAWHSESANIIIHVSEQPRSLAAWSCLKERRRQRKCVLTYCVDCL